MHKVPLRATFLIVGLLAACANDPSREFARYYDQEGLFTLNLPAANDVTVTQPQTGQQGPDLFTGVVSSPPAPSPSPASGLGGGFGATAEEPPDQTIYQALAVASEDFDDLDEMALFFLTGDPVIDVLIDDQAKMGGDDARMIVADVNNAGSVTAGVAAAMTLGDGETGYLIAAVFPPGEWDAEQADFLRIVQSFRSSVPPGLQTFPVIEQTS
ncbi:MAG TPA: hypothetical protein VJ774_00540 [Actinomycetota bacterium]|nr:hypothetical protein [Actinomycetota bacterium]